MSKRKIAASLGVSAGLALAIALLVFAPLRREHAKARARLQLERIVNVRDPIVVARTARSVLADLHAYRQPPMTDAETLIDRAGAFVLLGNHAEAIREYRAALRLEKRPEIYLHLGEALVASGNAEEGVRELTRAVLFDPEILNSISDGMSRQRVQSEVASIQARGDACR
jgi:tetratricopeptide (TPR) repeat protein